MDVLLVCVIAAAGIFELINGFHDTANAIASTVFTRALPVKQAIALSAIMNFIGALINEGVAITISVGLIDVYPALPVILAALLGAIAWDLFTWWFAIPSSSSHALIGSLAGSAIVFIGPDHVIWRGIAEKVVFPLFASPLMGFVLGFWCMKLCMWLFASWPYEKANGLFLKAQVVSSALMAYEHGSNDAQKTMGIITMALVSAGVISADVGIPFPVKVGCATIMAIGTAIGGGRIMKTVGNGVAPLTPAIGFVSQLSTAISIEVATLLGAPVSTTQIVNSSIAGASSSRSIRSVKWGMVANIVKAWFTTLPAAMALGAVFALVVRLFF